MSKLVWAKIWGLNSYFKNRILEIRCSYFVKTNNLRFCLNFLFEFLQWHLQGFSYLASTVLFSSTSFAFVGLLLVSNQIWFNRVRVSTEWDLIKHFFLLQRNRDWTGVSICNLRFPLWKARVQESDLRSCNLGLSSRWWSSVVAMELKIILIWGFRVTD